MNDPTFYEFPVTDSLLNVVMDGVMLVVTAMVVTEVVRAAFA